MKKLTMLMVLVLIISNKQVLSQTMTSPSAAQQNKYFVMKPNASKPDSVFICLDSVQMVHLDRFLNDSTLKYYEADTMLMSNINRVDSIMQAIKEKAESGEYGKTKLWTKILLFALAALLVGLIVYVLLRLKELNENSDDIAGLDSKVMELERKTKELSNNLLSSSSVTLEKDSRDLKNENREIKSRVESLEELVRAIEALVHNLQESRAQIVEQPQEIGDTRHLLYADSILEGFLTYVSDNVTDDTIFILKLNDETHASISLYEPAFGKIIANASYLDGCEKQIIGKNTVEVIQEGSTIREGSGKWRVVVPLKVEIR